MLEPRCNYCKTLHGVAAAINSTLNPDTVLNCMVENVTKVLEAKGCSILYLTPDKKHLDRAATYGLSEEYINKGPLLADQSISDALNGKAVNILDTTVDERVQYRDQKRKEGIASILCVPMVLGNNIIGVVRVYTAEKRSFTIDDVYFVEAIANLSAIAFENAKLYAAQQKDYESFFQEMMEWRSARWKPWMRL